MCGLHPEDPRHVLTNAGTRHTGWFWLSLSREVNVVEIKLNTPGVRHRMYSVKEQLKRQHINTRKSSQLITCPLIGHFQGNPGE